MSNETAETNTRDDSDPSESRGGHSPGNSRPDGPSILEFNQIANGANSLLIRLGTEIYTLRRTQSGKLILNK